MSYYHYIGHEIEVISTCLKNCPNETLRLLAVNLYDILRLSLSPVNSPEDFVEFVEKIEKTYDIKSRFRNQTATKFNQK